MAINEYQKAFNEQGYLNAEIITRKNYCDTVSLLDNKGFCHCDHCEIERNALKRKVNKIMGRAYYKDVWWT